jgi:AraC-like DNA-binding protein
MVMKSCLYGIAEEFLASVPLEKNDVNDNDISILIADYVRDNHKSKLTLEEIARKFGYDYNYMSRYFRRVFDMTFTDFLNIYRLESAIDLLEKTDKTITDIAYESGFGSLRNFNNFFCLKMKMSPSQYRKRSAR